MHQKTILAALKTTVPVMTGYIVLGLGFGILMQQNGFDWKWAFLSSALIYAGSLQFASVNLLVAGANLVTAVFTAIIINARHLFYSIALYDRYKDAGKYKPYSIYALTDETYSLVCATEIPKEFDEHEFIFYVSLFDQLWWVIGSVLGALIGGYLPFDTTGIEFSMTALFLSSMVSQWMNTKNHIPALVGLFSTLLCLIVFGSSNFLIPSMLLMTVILTVIRNRGEQHE